MSGFEIERKFLVKDGRYKELAFASSRIRQGYICSGHGRTVRVRIRDAHGYLTIKGPSTNGGLSRYPQEEATIQIQLPTAPEKREKMTAIVYQGVENMVNNGPKEDDIQKTKEYMLRRHAESLKNNGFWMGAMVTYALYGEDNVTSYEETLNSITTADVQEMAKRIFKSGNRIEVGMTSPVEN